jgi:hypothetical protein
VAKNGRKGEKGTESPVETDAAGGKTRVVALIFAGARILPTMPSEKARAGAHTLLWLCGFAKRNGAAGINRELIPVLRIGA